MPPMIYSHVKENQILRWRVKSVDPLYTVAWELQVDDQLIFEGISGIGSLRRCRNGVPDDLAWAIIDINSFMPLGHHDGEVVGHHKTQGPFKVRFLARISTSGPATHFGNLLGGTNIWMADEGP